jgi:hypothetical protein
MNYGYLQVISNAVADGDVFDRKRKREGGEKCCKGKGKEKGKGKGKGKEKEKGKKEEKDKIVMQEQKHRDTVLQTLLRVRLGLGFPPRPLSDGEV